MGMMRHPTKDMQVGSTQCCQNATDTWHVGNLRSWDELWERRSTFGTTKPKAKQIKSNINLQIKIKIKALSIAGRLEHFVLSFLFANGSWGVVVSPINKPVDLGHRASPVFWARARKEIPWVAVRFPRPCCMLMEN